MATDYTLDPLSSIPVGYRTDTSFARTMKAAMMPPHLPSSEDVSIGMCFLPGAAAGGELMDAIKVTDDIIAFLMIDSGGTGEQAVCISVMVKNCFLRHIRQSVSSFSIVERVNMELLKHFETEVHLRVFLGILDLHCGTLTYCNAGGVAPVVYRSAGKSAETLVTHGTGIAVSPDGISGESITCLGSGDCLVLFSQGIYQLFDHPAVSARESGAAVDFISEALSGAAVADLPVKLREKHLQAAKNSGIPLKEDITFLYAEMITSSGKAHLKKTLGFGADDVVYLQFLNYLEEMDSVTAVILSAMDFAGYPDELIRKMKIVLTELLVNAVVHGNRKESMKRVVVGHLIDRDRTVISIMDEGDGFDPSMIPDPTLPENIDKPCGRGLFIVRHYVETINFNRTGNCVTIIKNNHR